MSLLHGKHLLVLLFIPTKYERNPLKNKGNIKLWKNVNQKVNQGWHPMPDTHLPDDLIVSDFIAIRGNIITNILYSPFSGWTGSTRSFLSCTESLPSQKHLCQLNAILLLQFLLCWDLHMNFHVSMGVIPASTQTFITVRCAILFLTSSFLRFPFLDTPFQNSVRIIKSNAHGRNLMNGVHTIFTHFRKKIREYLKQFCRVLNAKLKTKLSHI